jgi:hypothetical protein
LAATLRRGLFRHVLKPTLVANLTALRRIAALYQTAATSRHLPAVPWKFNMGHYPAYLIDLKPIVRHYIRSIRRTR